VIIPCLLIVASSLLVVCQDVQQNRTSAVKVNAVNVASEGGPIALPNNTTHMGREHMIKVNHTNQPNIPVSEAPSEDTHVVRENVKKVDSANDTVKLPAFEVGQKNDNKMSVPKKDATIVDTHSSSSTSTTTQQQQPLLRLLLQPPP
jgi:hypothetical protein